MNNNNALTDLTADIVAAHVANNTVAVGDIANLIKQVHSALAAISETSGGAEGPKIPVVSVKASVKPDHIVCMECGRQQKTLKRHLQAAHSMSPAQYRKDYGLPDTYPMTAPNYSEHRKTLAKTIGLGREARVQAPDLAEPTKRKRKLSIKS